MGRAVSHGYLMVLHLGRCERLGANWVDGIVKPYVTLLLLDRRLLGVDSVDASIVFSAAVGRRRLQPLRWRFQIVHAHIGHIGW